MVFVKVRETYDLHTVKNKLTVIGIHTPKPDILKRNYPGLLMQCKAYRPVSADVTIACASMMPLDVQSVGTAPGDVAPEDVFNPILYKAMSNFGMSQLEARLNSLNMRTQSSAEQVDVDGDSAIVDVDTFTPAIDEFPIYYGLLSETHNWKHANPQAGLSMTNLRPLVWEMLYSIGDNEGQSTTPPGRFAAPTGADDGAISLTPYGIRGNSKPMPFINCTSIGGTVQNPGFQVTGAINAEQNVPWLNVIVGAIIIPPSRLHELFFRMVVEWTVEFSQIRSVSDIANWSTLGALGAATHYQNYNYEDTKKVITGSDESILTNDSCMVAANVEVDKVM